MSAICPVDCRRMLPQTRKEVVRFLADMRGALL
jgi:hypothetical protein